MRHFDGPSVLALRRQRQESFELFLGRAQNVRPGEVLVEASERARAQMLGLLAAPQQAQIGQILMDDVDSSRPHLYHVPCGKVFRPKSTT